jgi:hypothetical protein
MMTQLGDAYGWSGRDVVYYIVVGPVNVVRMVCLILDDRRFE